MKIPRVMLMLLTIMLLAGSLSFLSARDACTALLQETMRKFLEVCEDTSHGQACYGHPEVALNAFGSATLAQPGDLVDVGIIDTLTLSPMNIQERTWGMAMMRPRANLTGQNSASLLAFGDVTLRNARRQRLELAEFEADFPPFETRTLSGTATAELNIRSGPSIDFPRVVFLRPNQDVLIFGRSQDDMWLRGQLNEEVIGWISANFLDLRGGTIEDLPIVSDDALPPVSLQVIDIGDTLQATITDQVYEYRYAFSGLAGDVIDITMQAMESGTLDSYLVLQDERGNILASSNDSIDLDNFTDSQISAFTLPATQHYFITATRFLQGQGFSTGGFTLAVDYTPALNFLNPLQALDMASSTPLQPRCMRAGIPPSGILLQSPQVNTPIVFRINGLQIEVAGTLFLQADLGAVMHLHTLEGNVRAESIHTARFVPAGSVLGAPLPGTLRVTQLPDAPYPYDSNDLAQLPFNVLTRKIEMAPSIAPDALNNEEVVISLDWQGGADLDLRLVEPDEAQVRFGQSSLTSGATIPEDAAPECATDAASREQIVWPHGQPRLGKHLVQVIVFDDCGSADAIHWQLTIEAGNTILASVKGTGDDSIIFER